MSLINQKLEKILTDWMKTLSFDYDISFYSGVDVGDPGNEPIMGLPRCVISCPSATERIKDTGTFDIDLELMVSHSADDSTRLEHSEMCTAITSEITSPVNIISLNQTVDFYIYDIFPQSNSFSPEDRKWVSSIAFQVVGLAQNGFVAP